MFLLPFSILRGGSMEKILYIFFFMTVFLVVTALLYRWILKNSEFEKRLNYYLDIESKYKRSKEEYKAGGTFKESLKNANEYVREVLKRGLPLKTKNKIAQQLTAAGVILKPEEYVMARIFFAIVMAWIFSLIFQNIIFMLIGLLLGFYLPKLWLNHKRKKRIEKFNDSLLDMLTTVVASLKAGYSFPQALKTVAEESEPPMKDEIAAVVNEMNYGISLEEALNNLKNRMPSSDLELMIHSVILQRQIGGNLAQILGIIINTIRERNKLEKRVRTLTAQGRMTGVILGLLPVFLGVAFFILNRPMMLAFVSNRTGQIALAVGAFLTFLGYVVINKITKIEV